MLYGGVVGECVNVGARVTSGEEEAEGDKLKFTFSSFLRL